MISLIAGKYKGHKLHNFNSMHVRPTQAKVRKSIFQILEPLNGLKVLDLYAGIGTLGIEALSRGASNVIFVENNRRVFQALKKNLQLFDSSKCEVFLIDSLKYLTRIKEPCFDIVIADPPYSDIKYETMQENVSKVLKPNGIFCMEMKKEQINSKGVRINYYGSTQVVFWRSPK